MVNVEEIDLEQSGLTVNEVFLHINLSVPVPQCVMESVGSKVLKDLHGAIRTNLRTLYGVYESKSSSPHRPNVNFDTLISRICEARILEKTGTSARTIINMIKWINAQLSEVVEELPTKKANAPLYIGMIPGWEDMIQVWAVEHYLAEPRVPINVVERPGKRRKITKATIPKKLRVQVWDSVFPGERYGNCQVCKERLDMTNFEAGHIRAESKGGETSLRNLVPLCGQCNRSVGTKDLVEYCNEYKIEPFRSFTELLQR
jgi:5-methylcytosine-specific restriction endonuclease McrA